jgi:hypothetical protein
VNSAAGSRAFRQSRKKNGDGRGGSKDFAGLKIHWEPKFGSIPLKATIFGDETKENKMTIPMKAPIQGDAIEAVIARNDLAKLTPEQRNTYYLEVCRSIGLNPLTMPFSYITLNGKLVLYAGRNASDQLRKLNGISVEIVSRTISDGLLTVHVRAKDSTGRTDEDLGTVALPDTLKGEARANSILKAVTKAKRRVTLSIAGLGFLDESEVEDIPRRPAPAAMLHDPLTGEVIEEAVEGHEKFIGEAREHIRASTDFGALGAWWNSAEEKQKRRDIGLNEQEMQDLKGFVIERIAKLKTQATESPASSGKVEVPEDLSVSPGSL